MATESINAVKCVFQFFGFAGGPLLELKEKLFTNVVVSKDYLLTQESSFIGIQETLYKT
jgi:hypothetical protein